jgi:hypothetical protein
MSSEMIMTAWLWSFSSRHAEQPVLSRRGSIPKVEETAHAHA